jgi:hypothetical protein
MSKQNKKKPTKPKKSDSNRPHIYIGVKGLGMSEFPFPRARKEVEKHGQT